MAARIFRKGRIHLLVWGLMIVYLSIAPVIYSQYILKNGKPVNLNIEKLEPTDQIKFWVDRLDPIYLEGQSFYNLLGWGFLLNDPNQSNYDRFVVLTSGTRKYFFLIQSMDRPDIQKAFKKIGFDITKSGFSAYIAREVVQPDKYNIGILFIHKDHKQSYYAIIPKTIVVSPNKVELEQ